MKAFEIKWGFEKCLNSIFKLINKHMAAFCYEDGFLFFLLSSQGVIPRHRHHRLAYQGYKNILYNFRCLCKAAL